MRLPWYNPLDTMQNMVVKEETSHNILRWLVEINGFS